MKAKIDIIEMKANADYVSEENVSRRLTDDEIDVLKSSVSESQIFLAERAKAVANLRSAMKMNDDEGVKDTLSDILQMDFGSDGTKALKETTAICVEKLRSGNKETPEKVYGIAYPEDGVMVIYDSNGDFLYKRPLSHSEKSNPTLFNLNKKVANG